MASKLTLVPELNVWWELQEISCNEICLKKGINLSRPVLAKKYP